MNDYKQFKKNEEISFDKHLIKKKNKPGNSCRMPKTDTIGMHCLHVASSGPHT